MQNVDYVLNITVVQYKNNDNENNNKPNENENKPNDKNSDDKNSDDKENSDKPDSKENKKEKDTDTVRRIAFCISIFFEHFP